MVTDDTAVSWSDADLSRATLRVYSRVLRSLLDAVGEAVLLVDGRGEVLLYNQPFEKMAGRASLDRLKLTNVQTAFAAIGATLDERELDRLLGSSQASELVELSGERTVLCRVAALPLDRAGDGRIVALREVTHEQRELQELEHRALHDHLTGLPNRDLLLDRLDGALSRQAREGSAVGVLFLDLDGFKDINDRHGHAAGDAVLVETAARLHRAMRDADSVGRFGGDEFVVVCNGLEDEPTLDEICARIQDIVARPYELENEAVTVTTSVGAVLEWDHGMPPQQLIERADSLMYAAKRRGSRREILIDGWPGQVTRRARSARALREAFQVGQLELTYLPIVALDEQRPVAVEGLLRCQHPDLLMLTPAELLELVDQTTLVNRLTEWVLDEAAGAARLLDDAMGAAIPVIVNLSASQLVDDALPGLVGEAGRSHNVDPRSLGFDIAERVLAADAARLASAIASVRELGCPLYADDVINPKVATDRLATLGFAGIKLEASMIQRCADDANLAARTQAGVRLARSRGLVVIGEGVDDEQRLRTVRELDCDQAEGYGFFGFPREATDLVKLIV